MLAREKTKGALDVILTIEFAPAEIEVQFVGPWLGPDTYPQIELYCDCQRVETGPKVRNRAGHADFQLRGQFPVALLRGIHFVSEHEVPPPL